MAALSQSSSSGLRSKARGPSRSGAREGVADAVVMLDPRDKPEDDGVSLAAEADSLAHRITYFDTVRSLHKSKRTAGIVGCLIGCLVMLWGSEKGPDVLRYVGLGIVAASWLLFIYTVVARAAYVRKHPLEAGN